VLLDGIACDNSIADVRRNTAHVSRT